MVREREREREREGCRERERERGRERAKKKAKDSTKANKGQFIEQILIPFLKLTNDEVFPLK